MEYSEMITKSYEFYGKTIPNRVVFQPMEGCDCFEDGTPGELTEKKYLTEAASGAGIIWMEASAVCPEGRTNTRQMMLTENNLSVFENLLKKMRQTAMEKCGIRPFIILQLTHSGRQSIKPMIAYRHPIYEQKRPVTDENIVSDEYLDSLPGLYAKTALLAVRAGFDAVDVKSCHGYLFQEFLSAYTRPGKYGGSFENRTRLYLDSFRAVKKVLPKDFPVVSRLSVTDMVPKPYGFGTNEENMIDFTESDMLIEKLMGEGLAMLNVTLGNPYFNPHVNRPYRKGGYEAPEKPEEGLARFVLAEKHIREKFPNLPIVASGLSYYRGDLPEKSEKLLEDNVCDFVGFGRMSLAYPDFFTDWQEGRFEAKKCCVACSRCTALMRHHQVAGCAIFNEYYRNLYKEKVEGEQK